MLLDAKKLFKVYEKCVQQYNGHIQQNLEKFKRSYSCLKRYQDRLNTVYVISATRTKICWFDSYTDLRGGLHNSVSSYQLQVTPKYRPDLQMAWHYNKVKIVSTLLRTRFVTIVTIKPKYNTQKS